MVVLIVVIVIVVLLLIGLWGGYNWRFRSRGWFSLRHEAVMPVNGYCRRLRKAVLWVRAGRVR